MIKETEILSQINLATGLALGQEYFDKIGQIIQDITNSDYTFITKLDGFNTKAKPIVSIKHGVFIENIEYELENTPCLEVSNTCVGYFPSNVQELFPNDEYLKKIEIEGYIGASITGISSQLPFAIITCLFEKEPINPDETFAAIEIISKIIQERTEREYLVIENYELKKEIENEIKKTSEKDTLLKEIHHRVKNNLQIVASLLNLQRAKTNDPKVIDMITVSKDRIQSIALVHELLYNSDDFKRIDIKRYISKISNTILNGEGNTKLIIDAKNELIDLDTLIPCGLILCEAITNFLKHNDADSPVLQINFIQNINERILRIKDNGKGFPQNILDGNYDSLGLELIESLAEQINGQAKIFNKGGAVIEITFKV